MQEQLGCFWMTVGTGCYQRCVSILVLHELRECNTTDTETVNRHNLVHCIMQWTHGYGNWKSIGDENVTHYMSVPIQKLQPCYHLVTTL
jgi:hypothetical protein